jgi:hypothetical protein
MTGDVSLGDNVKAKFGAGNDLQIYHDGTKSIISDNGQGNLYVYSDQFIINNYPDTQNMARFVSGGAATLYHAGSAKLATTATGVDVTGSVTCDGFTSTGIDDNATSTAITIDSSENVGIGGNPESWDSNVFKALSITGGGFKSSFAAQTNGAPQAVMISNAYYSTGWKRGDTGYAAALRLTPQNATGTCFQFETAPTGAADSSVTWQTPFLINSLGHTVFTSPNGSDPAMTIYNTNNVIGDWDLYLKLGANGYNTTSYFIKAWNGVAGNSFLVLGNGNVQNLNNSYAGTSDLKLKENIIDASSQWEDVKALQIKNYSLKVDKRTTPNQLGVIAQDLEASGMGGLVSEVADTDEVLDADWIASEGETEDDRPTKHVDLGTTTKSVKYSVLYMKAVKALQEAMTKIEALEARVTALEPTI